MAAQGTPGEETAGAGGVDVTIEVTGLRSTRGLVRACLTDAATDFPDCSQAGHSHHVSVAATAAQTLRFTNVAPGTYAISLLHDENGNGRVDKALGMIPREGFGFSRDAPVRMGPPSFEAAAITVGHAPSHQTIRMRYLF